jgi:hypothetical protein
MIVGALLAVVSAIPGGLDEDPAALVLRGTLIALAIGVWGVVVERLADAEDRRRSGR